MTRTKHAAVNTAHRRRSTNICEIPDLWYCALWPRILTVRFRLFRDLFYAWRRILALPASTPQKVLNFLHPNAQAPSDLPTSQKTLAPQRPPPHHHHTHTYTPRSQIAQAFLGLCSRPGLSKKKKEKKLFRESPPPQVPQPLTGRGSAQIRPWPRPQCGFNLSPRPV